MKPEIKYIEYKGGVITGPARIGRITFSKTGRTIYYGGKAFRTLDGTGFNANYRDVATGEEYWISGCRKDGNDTLYPGIVEIDDDVREEYWTEIRDRRDCVQQTSFRSPGKYPKK